ncbi:hypothetical protein F2Q70_00005148 [Brassica cretica]|uniref:RIN4 pathogenic type III effector avirulence factor Avr cleavage site domain-containing protein n=1 Tax=Brassica cretica TaxID=69181 RepID=A0A8S9ING3_BRACR|nr:hypothetical protein F2Q70_00005148 [Brassica cretica]KAF3563609.1 hypothetical protein DY000_02017294 [Brassica cretica]
MEQDKGRPLPKFGEWDVNDPASAEGFTVIFNKARDEKKTGGKPGSPGKSTDGHAKSGGGGGDPSKPQPVKKMALLHAISGCGLLIGTKMDLFAAQQKWSNIA